MTLARTLSILLVLTLCLIAIGSSTASHWNGTRGGPDRNSAYDSDLSTPLGIEWSFEGNGELRTPLVSGDSALFSSLVRKVYAVDITNGSQIWESGVDSYSVKQQEIIGDRLYVKAGNRILNISIENGSRTMFTVPGGPSSAPIAFGPYLMLVNSTHLLAYRNDTLDWGVGFTGSPSLPATDGDHIFLRAGTDLYRVDIGGAQTSVTLAGSGGSPTVANNRVYIGTDTMIYEFRTNLVENRSINASYNKKALAVTDSLVAVSGSNIISYSMANFSQEWSVTLDYEITTPPIVFIDHIAVGTECGVSVVTVDGTHVQDLDIDDEVLGCIAPLDDGILAATDGGYLFKFSRDQDGDTVADVVDDFPTEPTQWIDSDGDGYGDNQTGVMPDLFLEEPTQWNDTDGDGYGDNPEGVDPDDLPLEPTQWNDTDGDGHGDNQTGFEPDRFIDEPTQWSDIDNDGYGDNASGVDPDVFPTVGTQWNDTDGDGYGDNRIGVDPDLFPLEPSQWADVDGDGYGDNASGVNPDMLPSSPTQWNDSDGDGYGDNMNGLDPDLFQDDPTQWFDDDGDGYGDNTTGNEPDKFPGVPSQWNDTDGDGFGDNQDGVSADRFIQDPTQWFDRDTDGYGDNPNGTDFDAFPDDPTQWNDTDEDGYGDEPDGLHPDAFPYDPNEWNDTDGDGVGDNTDLYPFDADNDGTVDEMDAFPLDAAAAKDTDGDGHPDEWNPGHNTSTSTTGLTLDAFPRKASQWYDRDGDGYGDNPTGAQPDAFPDDPVDWVDSDGDLVGDNTDPFPDDATEWEDTDGDGIGNNADLYPKDRDNDGHPDRKDDFPDDPDEWADSDGDGIGDKSDIIPMHNTHFAYLITAIVLAIIPIIGAVAYRRRQEERRKRIKAGIKAVSAGRTSIASKGERRRVGGYVSEAKKAVATGELERADKMLRKGEAESHRARYIEEMYKRYRGHLDHLHRTMVAKGMATTEVSKLVKESRTGPLPKRVDSLMKGVSEATKALQAHETATMLTNELKGAARELEDRGYAVGGLKSESAMVAALIEEGNYRRTFKLIMPIIGHIRYLQGLPRGSERPKDEVDKLINTRNVLTGGDPEAIIRLFKESMGKVKTDTWDDLITVKGPEPWGIDIANASKAVTPTAMDDAAVNLALHNLKYIYVFSGIGFTPDALARSMEMRIVRPMSVNEAMYLIWSTAPPVQE